MSNVLSEEKKQQILALGRLGWSLRRIEQATGVRRETAGDYLKAAGIEISRPGWRRRSPAKPAIQVATDFVGPKPANVVEVTPDFIRPFSEKQAIPLPAARAPASVCEPFRELIELGLSRDRNAVAIWQDLVTDNGFSGAYNTVKRFVGKLRGVQHPQASGIIITAVGEEAQVDYGTGPMVRDPQTGKYRRTRLFVLTLGYSRKSVRLLSFRSSSQIWAQLHETAFRRLGGCPRLVVLDNLREGVLAADFYEPALNPLFKDMLAHYGVTAMPCRVRDPDRKGKVESGVGHAQKTPLKGVRFETLEEAQTYLDNWELRWADTRIHGTTKRQVAAMFAEEKPALLPLLLPIRRTHRASGRLRRSRSGLLQRPAGLDRAARQRAVGPASCPHTRSGNPSVTA
jgi:transposase